jgi:flagellar hook-associated protein 3 FlgL
MRISQNAILDPFARELNELQNRKFNEEMKLTTGREINALSDGPKEIVHIKGLTDIINRNEIYMKTMDLALNEIKNTEERLDDIADKLNEIRQLAIDGASTSNIHSIGVFVRGLIEDLVKDANLDFNGKYLFAGTLTKKDPTSSESPNANNYPFELLYEDPTVENPSGMRVIFKGNNEDRRINKDHVSTEVINTKAQDIFGENGTELFSAAIDMYNLFTYHQDGTERGTNDPLSVEEMPILNKSQKKLGEIAEQVYRANSWNGAKINRINALTEQIMNENVNYKQYKSVEFDADIARTTLEFKKNDTALQYALQVGSRIIQNSLFDFLR